MSAPISPASLAPAAIALIVNAGAGPGLDEADTAALEAMFAAHRVVVVVLPYRDGTDLAARLQALSPQRPTALVAAGGDGTVNAVATHALAADLPLGVLPLGTLNHFARDLGLPLRLEDAVRVIVEGHVRAVDVGAVNGLLFLNNASIGLYPRVIEDRDRQRRRFGRRKWLALARATLGVLRHPRSFEIAVAVDGDVLRRRTPFLFVGNNDYVTQGFALGRRTRLDGGHLSLYLLRPKSGAGLAWMALRALLGRLSLQRDLELFLIREAEVDAGGSRVEIARDGEVCDVEAPVRFSIRPRALRVFAPAEAT